MQKLLVFHRDINFCVIDVPLEKHNTDMTYALYQVSYILESTCYIMLSENMLFN